VKNGENEKIIPSFKVKTVDTTGAGDAFNGCLAAALIKGKTLIEAVEFANAGAALSVTKYGTAPSMPRKDDIDEFMKKFQ
jgi:ribokinase